MSLILSRHSKPKRPTNVEFISYLMTQSQHGALVQSFVIEAIRYYAEQVASTPKPTEHGDAFISPIAWHNIAEEVLAKMKANYETVSDEHNSEGNSAG
jgi:hypothetical protein